MEKEKQQEKPIDIEKYLEEEAAKLNNIIHESLTVMSSDRSIEKLLGRSGYKYDPEALKKSIVEPALYLLELGGKRWRPTLMLATIEALGRNPADFVEFALIPEIIHNATLIHDDMEDRSLTRRGHPAVHIKYGEDVAINLGDFMMYFPVLALMDSAKLSPKEKDAMLSIYIREMTHVTVGQATDIAWHNDFVNVSRITEENYLQMAFDKTGVLARVACKLGAVLGGADDKTIDTLGRFGATIGVAFQLQDDILNIYPSKVSMSKGGVGEDITEGKITMLVIVALRKAREADKKRLLEILVMHTRDQKLIDEAIAIIDAQGSREYVTNVASSLISNSWAEVDGILPQSRAKNVLRALSEFLVSRSR